MKLTRKAEYAIRAMVDIASRSGEARVTAKEIALRQDIPPVFLTQVIGELKNSGLLNTTKGAGGGITLGITPARINVREIIEAIEGPIALNDCLMGENGCARKSSCQIHDMWSQAQAKMVSVLESTSLADLISSKKRAADPALGPGTKVSNEVEIEV
jgi:Rrf2 family protein